MKRVLSGIAVAFLMSAQAGAAEVVATAGPAVAPQAAAPAAALPLDGPAGQVADGAPPAPGEAGCRAAAAAADDRQLHGEVWAGVGTHGYRDVGTAVTAPVGRCGSVSIAIDRSQGALGGWRR